ncbi:uncharacterized protein [Cardiocondyla obscurior]|uniref:uncharacterized protein n=1 Tax=Cardiocondyla obscurior TaxID=286306 RepID=UPI003965810E
MKLLLIVNKIKDILIQLEHVRNQLKDKNEVAIIDEYTYNARQYSIGLTILCAFFTFVFITLQYFPSILIFPVLSKNVSQSRHVPIKMEYFIDQEKYFNLILLHVNVTFCIALVSILSIGTMLITYFIFTCGMFKITWYEYRKNHSNINTMKLTTHIMSIFETMIFLLIVFGVICLALNLFEVSLLFLYIIYMFISNYIGQNIIDHNNDKIIKQKFLIKCVYVHIDRYTAQWYESPLQIQKMILFLLQKGIKEFTLNVGGLFNASMECFAMVR